MGFFYERMSRSMAKIARKLVPLIVFSDLDGTLTVPKGGNDFDIHLHPKTFHAIMELDTTGALFVASSARSLPEIEAAFAGCPLAAIIANDGNVISLCDGSDPIYFGGMLPDYRQVEDRAKRFIGDMEGVRFKNMGAYFTMFIAQDHPNRKTCEFFLEEEASKLSCTMPLSFEKWATTISLGPKSKRTKKGAIEFLLPHLVAKYHAKYPDHAKDPIIVCAGDGHNDIEALRWVKQQGGFSYFIGTPESNDYCTHALNNVEAWAKSLNYIASSRVWYWDWKQRQMDRLKF